MRAVIKYVVFLILPITVVILWLAGVFHPRLSAKEIELERKEVKGLEIGEVEVIERTKVSFAGTLIPSDRAEISTRLMGFVSYVGVREGEFVKRGELLLRIDPRDTKAQVEAARQGVVQAQKSYAAALANFEAAKKTYERYKRLLAEKAVTQHEFDMVEAKFKAARAQLEMAKSAIESARQRLKAVSSNVSYAEVRAPFDGYVVRKEVDVGDIARPGYPLLVMEKPPYRVQVSLPEKFLGRVKVGDRLETYVPSLGKSFSARVVEIEPSIDPSSRTFRIKAEVIGKGVRGGLFARVFVDEPTKKTILIPRSAIYKRWDFTGVWVVKPDNTLELRFVRLGRRIGDKVEVLSGLSEGERIVVRGLEKACEGCKVGG